MGGGTLRKSGGGGYNPWQLCNEHMELHGNLSRLPTPDMPGVIPHEAIPCAAASPAAAPSERALLAKRNGEGRITKPADCFLLGYTLGEHQNFQVAIVVHLEIKDSTVNQVLLDEAL